MSTYFVSKEGKIFKNDKEKKLTLDKNYLVTNILGKKYFVHRLVAEKYIPNPENKPYINHINGNKLDNRVENLEWVTPKENIYHRDNIIKTCAWGEKGGGAKLNNEQVKEIKNTFLPRKVTYKILAKKYNVTTTTINRILNNKTFVKYA